MMSHADLAYHYHFMHTMAKHSPYTLTELEDMLPYELDIYSEMLIAEIEKRRTEQQQGR